MLPGETCPACKKNNHNVYETGCPTLATFCACKAFYDRTPKALLEPIKKQYEEYLQSIKSRMRKRRMEDKATLRRLQQQHPDDNMEILTSALHKTYVDDYPEAQYDENPYLNLEDTDDEEYISAN